MLALVWTAFFGASLNPMWKWFTTNKDTAGWVQAFGSIAAILATAGVVWWQETRRREDIRIERLRQRTDQLEGLSAMGRRLVKILSEVENSYDYFENRFVDAAFQDISAAFAEVPVHDARSYSVATAVMTLRRISLRVLEPLHWLTEYHLRTSYHPSWDIEAENRFSIVQSALDEAILALNVLEARLDRVESKLPRKERGTNSPPWKPSSAE
ncbi:MAG: hypothetical protein ACK4M2_08670 [Brevundimonas sp.]